MGELSLFSEEKKRSATVKTLTDCTIGYLSSKDFFKVCDTNKEIGYIVVSNIAHIVSENLINQHRLEYKKTKFDFFTLSKKHLDMGRNILKRFNLSKYKWHVAIHMRESKGLDDQSYRDVNPSNYLKGIHEKYSI